MGILLKDNTEGRMKFLELAEQGCIVSSTDDVFFMEKDDIKVAEISKKFSDKLIKHGLITKIE